MKQLSSILATLKRFTYGERIHPARDWFVILSGAVLLILLSIGWNLWLLKTVEEGSAIGQPAPALSETFNAGPVEAAQKVFETRRAEELRFRQEYQFVDPSR